MKQKLRHHLRVEISNPVQPTLRSVGYSKKTGEDSFFEATIKHLLICWSIKGTAKFSTDGAELVIPEGSCAIICPPARFVYTNTSPEQEICWMSYIGSKMDDYCLTNGLWSGVFLYPDPPVRRILELGTKIEEANTGGEVEWVRGMATLELDSIANNMLRHAKNKTLMRAIMHIHQDIKSGSLGVDGLAKQMRMHRKSLYSLSKNETGYSPKQYIKQARKHRICRLLRYSNLSLSEIAAETGYTDTAYFSKAFRKLFGKGIDDFVEHPCCNNNICPSTLCDSCIPDEKNPARGCVPKTAPC